jgi:hypothetical protein
MTTVIYTPEALEEMLAKMAEQVGAGNFRAARAQAKKLIKHAQIDHLKVIRLAAEALETKPPRVAVQILRQMWKDYSDDKTAQRLIEACAPPEGENRQLPQGEHGNREREYQPPQPVTRKKDAEVIRRRNSRQEIADRASFARYVNQSAGRADGDQVPDREAREESEKVYASGNIDPDRAAVRVASVKVPCLPPCGIAREMQDLDRARLAAGHGDDGLCLQCRADGADGVALLTPGHSRRDAMDARCDFIAQQCDEPFTALLTLRSQWLAIKDVTLRGYIGDWVAANLPDEDTARALMELGAGCANENCPKGPSPRMIRGVTAPLTLCGECSARVDEIEAEEAAYDEAARAGYQQHKAPSKRKQQRAKGRRAAVLAERQAARKATAAAKRQQKRAPKRG